MACSMQQPNLEAQKESTFYDILISFYMNNPGLYEKMEDDYSITVEKLDKLSVLSDYLKELSIYKSVADIVRAWQDLVKKFKRQLALENSAKSGSEAASTNTFPYYESLAFSRPAVQNKEFLSSMQLASKGSVGHSQTSATTKSASSSNASFNATPGESYTPLSGACCSVDVPSPSTKVRRPLNVPEYDGFAKKKLKTITEEEENMKLIGQRIIQTLDNINQKSEEKEKNEEMIPKELGSNNSPDLDYRMLLRNAVEKIPTGHENEFLELIIEELEKFDQEQATKDKID